MWVIYHQNDTMMEPDQRHRYDCPEKATAVLSRLAEIVQHADRPVVWNGPMNFTYRSKYNSYQIHYWIQKVS